MKLFLSFFILFITSLSLAQELAYEKDIDVEWQSSHYKAVEARLEANSVSTDGLEMYAIVDERSNIEKGLDWAKGVSDFPYYIRIEMGGMVMRCKLNVLTDLNKPDQILEVNLGLCKIQMLN